MVITATESQLWRIFENLLNNICKYAMPGTRVYIDLNLVEKKAVLTFKNMSEYPLNISADELTGTVHQRGRQQKHPGQRTGPVHRQKSDAAAGRPV